MSHNYQKTGRASGLAAPNAKLTPQKAIEIYLSKEKGIYLAALYNVSETCISAIKQRKTWRHITQYLEKPT